MVSNQDSSGIECSFFQAPVIKYSGPYYPPDLIACPMCGRCEVTGFHEIVKKVEAHLRTMGRPMTVAVMRCAVNGPGEARSADVAVAFGKDKGALFRKGVYLYTLPSSECLQALFTEIARTW